MLETLGKGYGMGPAFLVDDSSLLQNYAQHSHNMHKWSKGPCRQFRIDNKGIISRIYTHVLEREF